MNSIHQAQALAEWSKALDAWSQLSPSLREVAQTKAILRTHRATEALEKKESETMGTVYEKEPLEPVEPLMMLYGIYRRFEPSQSASADGYGSGSVSGETDNWALVGVATDRKNASDVILHDAYVLSGKSNVYGAAVSELNNYQNGVDKLSFNLSASWEVRVIKPNYLLPQYQPKTSQIGAVELLNSE
jgi:hypothetical protein